MHPKNISIYRIILILFPKKELPIIPWLKEMLPNYLFIKKGKYHEDIYKNIDSHIPENTLLVFNNTKVVEARLLFQKPTGGIIEIFCLDPHEQYADITTAMLQQGKVYGNAL